MWLHESILYVEEGGWGGKKMDDSVVDGWFILLSKTNEFGKLNEKFINERAHDFNEFARFFVILQDFIQRVYSWNIK